MFPCLGNRVLRVQSAPIVSVYLCLYGVKSGLVMPVASECGELYSEWRLGDFSYCIFSNFPCTYKIHDLVISM